MNTGNCPLSHISLEYLRDLEELDIKEGVEILLRDLPKFEAASRHSTFETAVVVFRDGVDPIHTPYLKRLNSYIRGCAMALALEARI